MKSRFLIVIFMISFFGGVFILKLFFSNSTDLTNFALGNKTVTYWAKDAKDNLIHISTIDSIGNNTIINSWNQAGQKKVLLVLGNSQTHSINQKNINEFTYVEMLNKRFDLHYVIANTFPNASLQDFFISYKYWTKVLPVKVIVIPLFLDDMRELNGITYDFYPQLVNNNFQFEENDNLLIKKLNNSFSTLREKKIKFEKNYENLTTQDKVEKNLNFWLENNSIIWNNRNNAQGLLFGKLYELRNTIFNIKANTVRRMLPEKYTDNMTALELLIKDAKKNDIKLFLYVPPIRKDVKIPYNPNEYNLYKAQLQIIKNMYPNTVYYKDFDNIVPGKYFGFKASTSFGKEKYEIDFMHFQFIGHKILFDSLSVYLFNNGIR
jgi:hypothetical protein